MNAYEENGSIISDCMEFGLPPLFPYADGTMPKQSGVEAKHARWEIDLNKSKLSAHKKHIFKKFLIKRNKENYLKINIHPDGGISRIRAFGNFVK